MTIQNWTLTSDCATMVCDTLATGGADNSPSAFVSKAWVVPHLSIMLAAMDWAYPAMSLYSHLAMGYAPVGQDDLIDYATNLIQGTADAHPDLLAQCPGSAVIMFRWEPATNEMEGWIFRVERGFAAERMPDGGMCALNPSTNSFVGRDMYEIALEQQNKDRALPARERNNLGGSLVAYEMKASGEGRPPSITITNYGQMPHYEEQATHVAAFRAIHGDIAPTYVRT